MTFNNPISNCASLTSLTQGAFRDITSFNQWYLFTRVKMKNQLNNCDLCCVWQLTTFITYVHIFYMVGLFMNLVNVDYAQSKNIHTIFTFDRIHQCKINGNNSFIAFTISILDSDFAFGWLDCGGLLESMQAYVYVHFDWN